MHCCSAPYNGDATFAGTRPRRSAARAMTCTLGPGEILFIPVGWWHHVVGLETTIGLSFTNFVWDNEAFRGYNDLSSGLTASPCLNPLPFQRSAARSSAPYIGSFVGALAVRWPERSVAAGRSACDGCGNDAQGRRNWCRCEAISACADDAPGAAAPSTHASRWRSWRVALVSARPRCGSRRAEGRGLAGALFGWALLALALLDARRLAGTGPGSPCRSSPPASPLGLPPFADHRVIEGDGGISSR